MEKELAAILAARRIAKQIELDLLGVEQVLAFFQEQGQPPPANWRDRLMPVRGQVNDLATALALLYLGGQS